MLNESGGVGSAMEQRASQNIESITTSTAAASSSAPTTYGPGTIAAPVELTTRSWVYTNGWATKRRLDAINYEVLCKFPGCKKMYKSVKGSMGNIAEHLKTTHKLTKNNVNDGKLVSDQTS